MRHPTDRRFRNEWIALLVAQCLLAALLTAVLAREQGAVRRAELERLRDQAKVVGDNFVRQLEGVDLALQGIRQGLVDSAAHVDQKTVSNQLKLLTAAIPGVVGMTAVGADGRVAAASLDDLIGRDFTQRNFFDVPRRAGDASRLYLLPPYYTRRGAYVMIASRILTDAHGAFSGVVTAELDPDYFTVLLRSVLYAPDMHAALLHQNGAVFVDVSAASGDGAGSAAAGSAAIGDPAGAASGPDALSGRRHARSSPPMLPSAEGRHVVTLSTLDRGTLHVDRPMSVSVSRDAAALLAPWVTKAWQFAGLWAVLGVAASLALWLAQRRRHDAMLTADALARERQAGVARVEQALRGADLGLWELHVPSDTFVINDRERELLGYAPGAALPQGPAWRALVHADDLPVIEAAIVPHLHGRAPNYECEHRMRHVDGHDVWVFSRAMIVERDDRGAPVRIVGTHLDITERRRVAERLARTASRLSDSEEEFRLLADNMPALISRLDRTQRFIFVNRAYADWLQIDRATLIGQPLREVFGETTYAFIRDHIDKALTGVRVHYERELATPTGPRRVDFTVVPEFDAEGAVKGICALATDITARHCAEQRLARSEERLSLALEGSGLALFDWDLVTHTIHHSAQAAAMRGDPGVEVTGPVQEQQRHVHPDDLPGVLAHLKDALAGRVRVYNAEFRLRCTNGDWLWVRANGRVVQRDATGRALRLAGTYADIHARKLAEGRLRQLAEFDTLTGLPNRALFGDRLQQAMARAARGRAMALLYLDIDRFKGINDTLGHETGDTVLKVYARRMEAVVRESDTVARLAGDEFTIILEAVRDAADAQMIAAKLIRALALPILLADGEMHVTASIGVAMYSPGETDPAALLRRADAALYEAKRRGRNSSFCTEAALMTESRVGAIA